MAWSPGSRIVSIQSGPTRAWLKTKCYAEDDFEIAGVLGGVDGFDQDEACCECDNGCEISLRLLAS